MGDYGMPSSGDPERDRRELEAFAKRQQLIDRGRCPNDDGDLRPAVDDAAIRECGTCGFFMATTTLYVGGGSRRAAAGERMTTSKTLRSTSRSAERPPRLPSEMARWVRPGPSSAVAR